MNLKFPTTPTCRICFYLFREYGAMLSNCRKAVGGMRRMMTRLARAWNGKAAA
eukprot:COSAG01_NODE_13998_length_1509_cov_1.506383_1_plen_52_part_10